MAITAQKKCAECKRPFGRGGPTGYRRARKRGARKMWLCSACFHREVQAAAEADPSFGEDRS